MCSMVAIVNNTELHIWKLPKEYSWPLKNMCLNYMSPLTHSFFFFSAENTTVLHNLQQKVNYKLHADFQLHRGLVPLMPTLFKGQLWVLKVLITRKKKWNYVWWWILTTLITEITLQCIQILTHFVYLTYNTLSQLYLNLKKRIYKRKVSKVEPHLVDAKEMNKLSFVSLARPLSLTAHPHTLLVSLLGHLCLMSLRHLWVLMAEISFSCLLSLGSPRSI